MFNALLKVSELSGACSSIGEPPGARIEIPDLKFLTSYRLEGASKAHRDRERGGEMRGGVGS